MRTAVEESKQDDGFHEDKELIAELDRRTTKYESGKTKVLTLDQLEARARKSYKAKSKKRPNRGTSGIMRLLWSLLRHKTTRLTICLTNL